MHDKTHTTYFSPRSKSDRKGPPAFSSRYDLTHRSNYITVRGKLYWNFPVQEISAEALVEEDMEPSDEGSQIAALISEDSLSYLFSCLTDRQRVYAQLLFTGYTRREIQEELHVSKLAVHRIIHRIRDRLKTKCNISLP